MLAGVSACSVPSTDSAADPASETAAEADSTQDVAAPDIPLEAIPANPGGREEWVDCPYLDTQWVADTNGQRMTGVGLDERFETPACVFWSYPEEPQAMVLVRSLANEDQARTVVDFAAPIDTTEPAQLPGGWDGGRGPAADSLEYPNMRVFAVSRGNDAVAVWTNQEQTFKAEQIAEEAIKNLGL